MSDSSIEENSNEEYKLDSVIEESNKINSSDKGTGDDFDIIYENDPMTEAKIKYIKSKDPFLLNDKEITYRLIQLSLNESGKKLIVIPGFSKKSYSWTIGRINRFLKDYSSKFTIYSDVYIFMLDEVKIVQSELGTKEFYKNKINYQVGGHINAIINSLFKNDEISIIGRSAGGDISLMLRNENIKDLHLASVGTSNEVLKNFIGQVNIPLKLYFHNNDDTVPIEEAEERIKLIKDMGYSNWVYTVIYNNLNSSGQTHRIHKELIQSL